MPRTRFVLITVVIYLACQTAIVLAHEFAHSTAAWLLGYTSTPATVVWGNPITMRGWDEGVPYDALFHGRGHPAEAVIGGVPLCMHVVFVAIALFFLVRRHSTEHRYVFYAAYWFVVVNLAELVAYFVMRPFAGGGDTGRFNQGLAISPYFLLVTGTLYLLSALFILSEKVMPALEVVVFAGDRWKRGIVVWLTAFVLFLWGSGLRILSLYPDRQWKTGLIGVGAFPVWILASHLRSERRVSCRV